MFKLLKKISLIKTLKFNVHYFGVSSLIHCPVFVGKNVVLEKMNGSVKINKQFHRGMIYIGISNNSIQDLKYERCIWNNNGDIIFAGYANIGCGAKIVCMDKGLLKIGNKSSFNGNSEIICSKMISFGDNCNISWNCLFMDTDFHLIKQKNGEIINHNNSIIIGNHVWVGCKCTILKGSNINNDCIVAACSRISKNVESEKCIIGNNGIILKKNVTWEMDMP